MGTRSTVAKHEHPLSLKDERGVAAGAVIESGKMVCLNAAGYMVEGSTALGLTALGRAEETVDNSAGGNGAKTCKYSEGVFRWDNSAGADEITQADVGKSCSIVSDSAVAKTDGAGTRSNGGVIDSVDAAGVWVQQGLNTASLAGTGYGIVPIPLTTLLDADGDPLAKFVSAASPTFGFNLADGEAFGVRWNNDATPGTAMFQVELPPDLDTSSPARLEFLCSKSGATVGDAVTLTLTVFILAIGDLHDADANAGGVTNALVGNAPAKTTALLFREIPEADIPVGARVMFGTVTPTAGTLGTDDLIITGARLRYRRLPS